MPNKRSGLLITLVLLGVLVGALCWTAGAHANRGPRAGSQSSLNGSSLPGTSPKGEPDMGSGRVPPMPNGEPSATGGGPGGLSLAQRLALMNRVWLFRYLGI
jgi:hypothetical protein